MHFEQNILRKRKACALFFLFLSAVSVGMVLLAATLGRWVSALSVIPGAVFFGALAWWTLAAKFQERGFGGDSPGRWEVGCPVPVLPTSPHHLVAAKAMPPSEKTYLFQKD